MYFWTHFVYILNCTYCISHVIIIHIQLICSHMITFVPWSSQCFLAYVFLVDVCRDSISFSRNKSIQWNIILSILFKKKCVCKKIKFWPVKYKNTHYIMSHLLDAGLQEVSQYLHKSRERRSVLRVIFPACHYNAVPVRQIPQAQY